MDGNRTEICIENKGRKRYIQDRLTMIAIVTIIIGALGTHWGILLNLPYLVILMFIFFGTIYFFTIYYYLSRYPKIICMSSSGIKLKYSKKERCISWDEIDTMILAGPPAIIHKNEEVTYLYTDKILLKKIYDEFIQRKNTHASVNVERGNEN